MPSKACCHPLFASTSFSHRPCHRASQFLCNQLNVLVIHRPGRRSRVSSRVCPIPASSSSATASIVCSRQASPVETSGCKGAKLDAADEVMLWRQRPDEAIHRGFDKTTELDMSKSGNFISNFEPLTREQARIKFCLCFCVLQQRVDMHAEVWFFCPFFCVTDEPEHFFFFFNLSFFPPRAGSRHRRRHHRIPEVYSTHADAAARLPGLRQAHLLRLECAPAHRGRQAVQEPPLSAGCPGQMLLPCNSSCFCSNRPRLTFCACRI